MREERRRLYDIIAYEEYFTDLMYNIMQLKNLRWYWSYHDKDLKEDGTIKEPHYHILLYFNEGCTLSALLKKINFYKKEKINFYKKGSDEGRLDYRVRYLIHYKSSDKNRNEYNIEDIHTNDDNIDRFFPVDSSKSTSDIQLIFDFFDSHDSIISYRTFLNYIYANNLWGTFRQNAYIFNRLFDEHNNESKLEFLDIFK
uniref:Replication protein n=1 Tax=Dulem virus 71 TaxID=3145782 RepID=A0AAU8AXP2_9VIRU